MIRKVIKSDVDFITNIEEETLGTTLGNEMIINEITNNPFAYYFVITNSLDKNVGYISTNFDGEIVEILNICVSKEYSHQGYGTLLLTYVINNFISLGAKSVFLEVRESNYNAISFYNKFGFKLINKRKNYYKTEDALVLQLLITNYFDIADYFHKEFCDKVIENNDYIKYCDSIQKDKYDNNYYIIKNESYLSTLISNTNEPFINIKSLKKINIDGFIESKIGVMHLFNNQFKNLKPIVSDAIVLDGKDEKVKEFVYNVDKQFGINYAKVNSQRLYDKVLNNNHFKYIYIKNNDEVIGCLLLVIVNNTGFIQDFEVSLEYRHKGYGNTLVAKSIEYLLQNNCYDCYLEVDMEDTPKDMYKKMGFEYSNYYYEYFRG